MSFKVESILSFILCPSSFIQRKSFILYPNVIPKVRWMRKRLSKKDTRTPSYATLKNNGGCVKIA